MCMEIIREIIKKLKLVIIAKEISVKLELLFIKSINFGSIAVFGLLSTKIGKVVSITVNICVFIEPNLKYIGKIIELNIHANVRTITTLFKEIDVVNIGSPAVFPIKPITIEYIMPIATNTKIDIYFDITTSLLLSGKLFSTNSLLFLSS